MNCKKMAGEGELWPRQRTTERLWCAARSPAYPIARHTRAPLRRAGQVQARDIPSLHRASLARSSVGASAHACILILILCQFRSTHACIFAPTSWWAPNAAPRYEQSVPLGMRRPLKRVVRELHEERAWGSLHPRLPRGRMAQPTASPTVSHFASTYAIGLSN